MLARRVMGLGLAMLVLAGAACSTFAASSDTETPSPDAAPGADANETEASTESDVGTDATDAADAGLDADVDSAGASINLLKNSDFDTDCGNWGGLESTAQWDGTDGHNALGSCRVCIMPGQSEGTFAQMANGLNLAVNTSVVGTIWYRADPSSTPVSDLRLNVLAIETATEPATMFDTTWRKLMATVDIGAGGANSATLSLSFGTSSNVVQCFLVDDATLRAQ